MIAIVLSMVVVAAVFALFDSVSNSFQTQDQLVDAQSEARFVLQQVAADVRSAGSFASPDTNADPWARPRPAGGRLVGLSSYAGWQDDITLMSAEQQAANPNTSFDGIVVVGAFDYPQTFEIATLTVAGTNATGALIPRNDRGLYKLLSNNPFDAWNNPWGNYNPDYHGDPTTIDDRDSIVADATSVESLTQDMPFRALRIMDRRGFMQFTGIDPPGAGGNWWQGISVVAGANVALNFAAPLPQVAATGEGVGLEPPSMSDADIGYDAALLDAYWYHVIRDPQDPNNFQLVRERLDAGSLMGAGADPGFTNPAGLNPANHAAVDQDGNPERVVMANNVVDFQIWVDCAGNDGSVTGTEWTVNWITPAPTDAGFNCLDGGSYNPGRVRMVHLRLTVRSEYENANLVHAPYLAGPNDPAARIPLQTYDIDPNADGAARVVTVQSDVELTNFAERNL